MKRKSLEKPNVHLGATCIAQLPFLQEPLPIAAIMFTGSGGTSCFNTWNILGNEQSLLRPPETMFWLCSHPPGSLSGVPIRCWGSHRALSYLPGPLRPMENLLATVKGMRMPILLPAINYPFRKAK